MSEMRIKFSVYFSCVFGVLAFMAEAKDENKFDRPKAEKLCSEGDMGACFGLAEYLEKSGEMTQALPHYEAVCEKQIEDACLRLGTYHDEKPSSEKEALKWFRKACQVEKNSGQGCYEVARIAKRYDSKTNVLRWLKKACDKGYKPGCV